MQFLSQSHVCFVLRSQYDFAVVQPFAPAQVDSKASLLVTSIEVDFSGQPYVCNVTGYRLIDTHSAFAEQENVELVLGHFGCIINGVTIYVTNLVIDMWDSPVNIFLMSFVDHLWCCLLVETWHQFRFPVPSYFKGVFSQYFEMRSVAAKQGR